MIDGKLADLQQATNVQVIIQGKHDGAAMFLVNENGIILSINAHHTPQAHVTSHNEMSAGIPGGNDQLVQLSSEQEAAKLKIKELESRLSASMGEVDRVLVRQKQKV